ncbi:MAG: glycosyltransferase family 4 protein [Chloroflexi bacterium]|nr:MAG: glycosyltransferase family 4 protein [Chloroflexota bacterium]
MKRHIAIVAPPWYPVPPHGYGGIELIVGLLADELRSRGHRVTLIAGEGSTPDAHVAAPHTWCGDLGRPEERWRELTYAARVGLALTRVGPIDVIHDHCGFGTLLGLTVLDIAPVLHTVHGTVHEPLRTYYTELSTVGLIAISESQRRSATSLRWSGVVHNAVDVDALTIGERVEREPYLLCLARICPDKGQHLAIEVARQTGLRLVLAGKVEPSVQALEYYQRFIVPALEDGDVVHLHNVAGAQKAQLLAQAAALLHPIQWDEPFGLSVVEAMASGTPAIALARGAAAELIVPGVTGFLTSDVDGMVAAVRLANDIDPMRCAALARERFSPAAMTDGYLRLYEDAISEPDTWTLRTAAAAGTAPAPMADVDEDSARAILHIHPGG